MKRLTMKTCALFIAITPFGAALSEGENKDPLYRDESIAGVEVDVSVDRLPSGNWEYVYSIHNPDTSNGSVIEFRLDQSGCSNSDELAERHELTEPGPEYEPDDLGGYTKPPRVFVPMYVFPVPGKTSVPMYGRDADLIWHMPLEPGESVEGIRIISVTGPAPRAYLVSPGWASAGWDYGKYFGTDTKLPRQKDFWVEGMTTGPGCEREASK